MRFRLKKGEAYLSFEEVFNLWANSSEFIAFYKEALIQLNYQAFYWEHPAINKEFINRKYECIVKKSKPLEYLPANENAFKDHLFKIEQFADFMNLGNPYAQFFLAMSYEH